MNWILLKKIMITSPDGNIDLENDNENKIIKKYFSNEANRGCLNRINLKWKYLSTIIRKKMINLLIKMIKPMLLLPWFLSEN